MTNIASLISAKTTSNNMELKVKDSDGHERTLNLSPRAQEQFRHVLLVSPPLVEGEPALRPPLQAVGVSLAENADKQVVLGVLLGPQKEVHIALPRQCVEYLRTTLKTWLTPTN